MNVMGSAPATAQERAIRFTGSWREYLPIAATNVLLIIVTLGIYRFWAAARQRRRRRAAHHVHSCPPVRTCPPSP